MSADVVALAYLFSALCFILALAGLAHPRSARRGNALAVLGMAVAVGVTLSLPQMVSYLPVAVAIAGGAFVGVVVAVRVAMTALPQLVAAFHSLVGLAAVLVAAAAFHEPSAYGIVARDGVLPPLGAFEMAVGLAVGALTFTGSLVAFAKLHGLVGGAPFVFRGQHLLNLGFGCVLVAVGVVFVETSSIPAFWLILFLSGLLGVTLIAPIGGADMPVVVSMLNSYSGWAAAGIGFTLSNSLLIIVGALVGASGAILSYIMCKGMNRSFISVILGGFGAEEGTVAAVAGGARPVKSGNAEDASFLLSQASSVVIVPGYGMAVAQAQHAVQEMASLLVERGVRVRYAIHPVAGRMPGHMNVLLAEANAPYEDVVELEEINNDFPATDVAFVIGANDITNPAARNDKASSIYGMPILDVGRASAVVFVKRSLGGGYAGIDNALFYGERTMMVFGDARKVSEGIVRALR